MCDRAPQRLRALALQGPSATISAALLLSERFEHVLSEGDWRAHHHPHGGAGAEGRGWLLLADEGGTVGRYSLRTTLLDAVFFLHRAAVTHMQAVPSCGALLSASLDRTVAVSSLRSGQLLTRITGHLSGVARVCLAHNNLLLSASVDGPLLLWDLTPAVDKRHRRGVASGKALPLLGLTSLGTVPGLRARAVVMHCAPSGGDVAVVCEDGIFAVVDAAAKKVSRRVDLRRNVSAGAVVAPAGTGAVLVLLATQRGRHVVSGVQAEGGARLFEFAIKLPGAHCLHASAAAGSALSVVVGGVSKAQQYLVQPDAAGGGAGTTASTSKAGAGGSAKEKPAQGQPSGGGGGAKAPGRRGGAISKRSPSPKRAARATAAAAAAKGPPPAAQPAGASALAYTPGPAALDAADGTNALAGETTGCTLRRGFALPVHRASAPAALVFTTSAMVAGVGVGRSLLLWDVARGSRLLEVSSFGRAFALDAAALATAALQLALIALRPLLQQGSSRALLVLTGSLDGIATESQGTHDTLAAAYHVHFWASVAVTLAIARALLTDAHATHLREQREQRETAADARALQQDARDRLLRLQQLSAGPYVPGLTDAHDFPKEKAAEEATIASLRQLEDGATRSVRWRGRMAAAWSALVWLFATLLLVPTTSVLSAPLACLLFDIAGAATAGPTSSGGRVAPPLTDLGCLGPLHLVYVVAGVGAAALAVPIGLRLAKVRGTLAFVRIRAPPAAGRCAWLRGSVARLLHWGADAAERRSYPFQIVRPAFLLALACSKVATACLSSLLSASRWSGLQSEARRDAPALIVAAVSTALHAGLLVLHMARPPYAHDAANTTSFAVFCAVFGASALATASVAAEASDDAAAAFRGSLAGVIVVSMALGVLFKLLLWPCLLRVCARLRQRTPAGPDLVKPGRAASDPRRPVVPRQGNV